MQISIRPKPAFLIALLVQLTFVSSAIAASRAEAENLAELLGANALIDIVREEGLAQAEDLRTDMFSDRDPALWASKVDVLYKTDRLMLTFLERFSTELSETDVSSLIDFFGSLDGKQLISLEIDARRAIMEPDIEEAARSNYREQVVEGGPRLDQLNDFVEANDMINYNVMGAMNASLAFLRGLADGGAVEMTEDQILSDLWAQEGEIRTDTTEWLFGYMLMAYEPLSDAQVQAYIDISETKPGRALNAALFAGFNAMFDEVSYELGRAASGMLQGDDI